MSEDLSRAFAERTTELEIAQRQILAFRLEASVRAAFVLELQQALTEALARAERAEHELRLALFALAEERAREAIRIASDEERISDAAMRLIAPIIAAMRA
jgi:hypothetical protein